MSNIDIIGMCLRNLFKRKLRTILTVLGVVIGTASIVVMISLGLAVNLKFEQEIEKMGDITLLTVQSMNSWYRPSSGSTGGQPDLPELDDDAIEAFMDIPGVLIATPVVEMWMYLKSGEYVNTGARVFGVKPQAMEALGYTIQEGRLLQDGDTYNVVFGAFAEANFFEQKKMNDWSYWNDRFYQAMSGEDVGTLVDIFTDRINMHFDYSYVNSAQSSETDYDFEDENAPKPIVPYSINVVGLLQPKNDYSIDGAIFMDIEIVKRIKRDQERQQLQQQQQEDSGWRYIQPGRNTPSTTYETAYVKCIDFDSVQAVGEKIIEMGYSTYIPTQWLDYYREQASSQQLFFLRNRRRITVCRGYRDN